MQTEINIRAFQVLICLFVIMSVICLMHVVAMVAWYKNYLPDLDWVYYSIFDLDEESSIGTWFGSLLLFLAGQLSLLAVVLKWHTGKIMKRGWISLAIGFHVLSLDEIAGFHELFNTVVEMAHWTLFGSLLVIILLVLYIPFLKSFSVKTMLLFLLAGATYVGGAVGIEMATIYYEDNDLLDTLEYNLWNTLEEGLEMFGVILYIYALLDGLIEHYEACSPKITFSFMQDD